jgi:transcriptional regulator with XRE-family HTH domain
MVIKKSDIIKRISYMLDENSDLSRKGLTAFSGISAQTISSWLNRGSLPSADLFPVIANYLGVSVHWLITGEDEQGLTLEERNLLAKYRNLDRRDRYEVNALLDAKLKGVIADSGEGGAENLA